MSLSKVKYKADEIFRINKNLRINEEFLYDMFFTTAFWLWIKDIYYKNLDKRGKFLINKSGPEFFWINEEFELTRFGLTRLTMYYSWSMCKLYAKA